MFFSYVCDGKRCDSAEKDDFNQGMACEVPVCWSKYTIDKQANSEVEPKISWKLINQRIQNMV